MRGVRGAALVALAAVLALVSGGGPWESEASGPYDFSSVASMVQAEVSGGNFPGASMLVVKDGQTVYEQHFGTFGPSTQISIASSSKWVGGAVIMSLVDDGLISLDDTVSEWLPSWTGEKGSITVRQLFSHTSGLPPDHACLGQAGITLEQCVDQIYQLDLLAPPGAMFWYGGTSMQVAGRIAEVASGKTWAQLFADRIRTPLNMPSTFFWPIANPQIGGGVFSTLADYGNMLRMMQAGGAFGSQQVLDPAVVAAMEQDQTGGAPIWYNPHPDGRRYGIGVWRDIVGPGGQAVQVSSQGKWAMSPWLDRDRRYFAIFFVYDDFTGLYSWVAGLQTEVRGIIDAYDTDDDGLADGVDPDDDNDSQVDTEDGCASTATLWATPIGDTECDGFPGVVTSGVLGREDFMGTDPGDRCADTTTLFDEEGPAFGEPLSPWPPDINDSGRADLSDVVALGPSFNKSFGQVGYNVRMDLTAGPGAGAVNLSDVVAIGPFFNKLCVP